MIFMQRLRDEPEIDNNMKKQGRCPVPQNNKLTCECGFETDLLGIINDIEVKSGKKVI